VQPDRFLAVQNVGNSGVPGSPHYRDQFETWIDGMYHIVHLRQDEVAKHPSVTTQVVPG
jgi:penicillin G amidase